MNRLSDTKKRILKEAERFFQRRGYNGFSYKDIASLLGVKNAAIHYHFPSKADLAVAMIERYRDILRKVSTDFKENGGDPREQLEAYFDFVCDSLKEGEMICPVGIVGTDFYTIPEPAQREAELLVHELLEWLTHVLNVGREDGTFRFGGRSEDRAISIKACLQGAAQLGRIMGPETLDCAINEIRRDVGISV